MVTIHAQKKIKTKTIIFERIKGICTTIIIMTYWNVVMLIICARFSTCEIKVSQTSETNEDWWKNSIIYEIFPLSFKDSNGDGCGDFKGITEKVDYLVDIGVTAIWLTPFLESPLKSGGYDISDYLKVQSVFGTLDDFKDLVNVVHDKNLKIIMDFVPNHTSDEHVWFNNSINKSPEYADYYIWKDAKNQNEVMYNNSAVPIVPNNWKRCLGIVGDDTAWYWHNSRKQFYFSQFIGNLPDLNFRHKNVHEEMRNILSYWLEFGLDGIRIDALKHVYESVKMNDEPIIDSAKPEDYSNLNHIYTVDQDEVYSLIKEWRIILDEFKQKYGTHRIIMTESYSPLDVLFKYYSSGVEIPTNFNLINTNHRNTPKDFDQQIQNWITKMPVGATYNNVLQNHDTSRVSTLYGTGLIDGMNALSLFLPGVAIVYYGGEIGMEDIQDRIQRARSPMQWNNKKHAGFTENSTNGPWVEVHQNYVTRNVQTEMKDSKSFLNFFKSVAKLRKTKTLKEGGLATYIFNENVFVLNRYLSWNENYTLVINMDSNPQDVRLSDQMTHLYGRNLTVVLGSGNSNIIPSFMRRVMGLVKVEFWVRNFTTRTFPSAELGYTSVTLARGQCAGREFSSFNSTKSFFLIFGFGVFHLARCCKVLRYSEDHFFQKVMTTKGDQLRNALVLEHHSQLNQLK